MNLVLLIAVFVTIKPEVGMTSFPVAEGRRTVLRRRRAEPLRYYVVEELPVSTPIGRLPGFSEDNRKSGYVRFSIRSQTLAERSVELFNVDETSGVLRTSGRIDRDTLCSRRWKCEVVVDIGVVRSTGDENYFRLLKIVVEILDVNDHAPDFGTNKVELTVAESSQTGSSYALPVAVDADSEQYGIKEYRMRASDESERDEQLPFRLEYVER